MIEDAILDTLSVTGMTFREALVRSVGDYYKVSYGEVIDAIAKLIDEKKVKVSTDSMNHQYLEVA